jgi:hypothetical protein
VLFDTRDSDESLDGIDFEEPSSAEEPQKALEDLADNSIPLSPSGDDFVLASRTSDVAPLEPAGSPSAPLTVLGFSYSFLCTLNSCRAQQHFIRVYR